MKSMKPARLTSAILLVSVFALLVPSLATAAVFENPLGTGDTSAKDIIKRTIKNTISFIIGLSAIVALTSLVYGGLRLILGASLSESEIARAKQIIFWSIIGLVVIGMAAAILSRLALILLF